MQTLDFVSGLHNCLEFSQTFLVFISGYANTENVFYRLNNELVSTNQNSIITLAIL